MSDDREDPADPGAYTEPEVVDPGAEYEPDQPDPEADLADPERELPNVPTPPRPGDADDLDPAVQLSFWWLVVVFNAALLVLWVGLLLVGFRGDWRTGSQLFVAGAILFAYGLVKFYTSPIRDRDEAAGTNGE